MSDGSHCLRALLFSTAYINVQVNQTAFMTFPHTLKLAFTNFIHSHFLVKHRLTSPASTIRIISFGAFDETRNVHGEAESSGKCAPAVKHVSINHVACRVRNCGNNASTYKL
jgi:hypothetical protein